MADPQEYQEHIDGLKRREEYLQRMSVGSSGEERRNLEAQIADIGRQLSSYQRSSRLDACAAALDDIGRRLDAVGARKDAEVPVEVLVEQAKQMEKRAKEMEKSGTTGERASTPGMYRTASELMKEAIRRGYRG